MEEEKKVRDYEQTRRLSKLELMEKKAEFLTNRTRLVGLPPNTPLDVQRMFAESEKAWKRAADMCEEVIEHVDDEAK